MRLTSSVISPRWRCLLLLPVIWCLSCEGATAKLYPVKGKVLVRDKPTQGVVVTFHPVTGKELQAVTSTGMTDADGVYTLSTGDKPGAAAGDYVVTFMWPLEVAPAKTKVISTEPPPGPEDKFKGAYAAKSSSAFKATVKAGENQIEPFNLK